MLNKEECLEALRDIEFNLPILYINSEYGLFGRCAYVNQIEILKNLIYEHFNNPPLKWDELKEDMWIWDNKECEYIFIDKLWISDSNKKMMIYKGLGSQVKSEFIDDRFYREEVHE